MPPGSLSLDTHQLRYIVDPDLDTVALNEQSLSSSFKKELTINSIREQQITPRWIGLIGEDSRPSVQEIELYIKDASSLIYMNTENIVSLLTPERIAMLNTTDLQMLWCNDRVKIRSLKDRIVHKTNSNNFIDRENEDPVHSAQLLTLAGAKSLLTHQYNILVDWSLLEMSHLLHNFLDNGLSLSESVYFLRTATDKQNSPEDETDSAVQPETTIGALTMHNSVIYGFPNFILNGSS